jgi:hypothetical protein
VVACYITEYYLLLNLGGKIMFTLRELQIICEVLSCYISDYETNHDNKKRYKQLLEKAQRLYMEEEV